MMSYAEINTHSEPPQIQGFQRLFNQGTPSLLESFAHMSAGTAWPLHQSVSCCSRKWQVDQAQAQNLSWILSPNLPPEDKAIADPELYLSHLCIDVALRKRPN